MLKSQYECSKLEIFSESDLYEMCLRNLDQKPSLVNVKHIRAEIALRVQVVDSNNTR